MNWQNTIELAKDVHWVGARDWNRRLFDALIPLPGGTTYNSYLVMGKKKNALIDTVNPGFEKELEDKIRKITDPSTIEYVVMNHAEPDHSGSIPYIMSLSPQSKLVTSVRGAKMAKIFYDVPENRTMIVRDLDLVELGEKTLQFIEAPMLHWPETMFTYLKEDKILFPCDFFGSHMAKGDFSDEVEDSLVWAQRYYGEIMMPFSSSAQRGLEKIKELPVDVIAPSHGPIHRKPDLILNAYRKWTSGQTKNKVTIIYVTMWHSTEKMINPIADVLSSEGVEVALHNLASFDIAELAKDLVDSRAIVLGTPTVLAGAHPLALYATYLIKALRPPLKHVVILSSYGWGGGAIRQIREVLDQARLEITDTLEVNGPPNKDNVRQIVDIGRKLADQIKGESS